MDERRYRGRTQRIFLINTDCRDDGLHFEVLGTSGNAYQVHQKPPNAQGWRKWRCTCPDFERRRETCKHIYFVDDRVLKNASFEKAVELVKQREFAPQLWADQQANGQADAVEKPKNVERREWLEQECAICTEPMTADEPTYWCQRVCGNSLHASCWRMWCKAKGQAQCPYCRAVG